MKIKINTLQRKQWYIVIGVILIIFLLLKERYQKISLPIYGQLSDFEMTDSTGNPFGSKQLRGSVWIANFIFTTCPGECLVMSQNMSNIHRSFVRVPNVHCVSITVNPETDTPPVLAEYAKKYNANTQKWHFLTDKRSKIRKLLKNEFRVGFQDNIIFHSVYSVLVDDLLRIRGYYDTTNKKQLQKLIVDIAFQSKRSHKRLKKLKALQNKMKKNKVLNRT